MACLRLLRVHSYCKRGLRRAYSVSDYLGRHLKTYLDYKIPKDYLEDYIELTYEAS